MPPFAYDLRLDQLARKGAAIVTGRNVQLLAGLFVDRRDACVRAFQHAVDAKYAVGALRQPANDGCPVVSAVLAGRLDPGEDAIAAARRLQLLAGAFCLAHLNEHARSLAGQRFIPLDRNRDQLSVFVDLVDLEH